MSTMPVSDSLRVSGLDCLDRVTVVGGEFASHADLQHDGKFVSKVRLATARSDVAGARWALDSKSRDFIDEWTMHRQLGIHGQNDLGQLHLADALIELAPQPRDFGILFVCRQ